MTNAILASSRILVCTMKTLQDRSLLLTTQTSPDNAYVIAFSLMMLHTDVFNSNNKSKMSKAEYVKNTRLDGVPQIVLEVS